MRRFGSFLSFFSPEKVYKQLDYTYPVLYPTRKEHRGSPLSISQWATRYGPRYCLNTANNKERWLNLVGGKIAL